MKHIVRLLLGIAFTVPAFIGLVLIDPLSRWIHSDSTLEKLGPLFKIVGADGVEGVENVIVTLQLVASFFIAWGIVYGASMVFEKWRNSRVK